MSSKAPAKPPPFWHQACQYLTESDPALGELIQRHSGDLLVSHGDLFRTLINAIVGQQISVAAAAAIWGRLTSTYNPLTPEAMASADPLVLKTLGLSRQKIEYLQGIGRAFNDPAMDPIFWVHESDDKILTRLTSLRGVGPWTAQMVLIFSLVRPDVLPLGDIGLLRSAARVYGWAEEEKAGLPALRQKLEPFAERWKPYRTVATWFLWRELDAEPVLY
ncbi:MAG: DNA-3-methyladenine glycosylase 2 family protein [Spirochaetales bacterium]|nr:DNA-3-methyladenine glycosylase 2 family protein [Spirochaetales bacterium]